MCIENLVIGYIDRHSDMKTREYTRIVIYIYADVYVHKSMIYHICVYAWGIMGMYTYMYILGFLALCIRVYDLYACMYVHMYVFNVFVGVCM